jgi:hypothetical protein
MIDDVYNLPYTMRLWGYIYNYQIWGFGICVDHLGHFFGAGVRQGLERYITRKQGHLTLKEFTNQNQCG